MAFPITCIEDLRSQAKRRLPRMFFDFVDGGAWSEITCAHNTADFDALRFRQRVAANLEAVRCDTEVLGRPQRLPLAIAPTGLSGFIHGDGEILAARAAKNQGIPFTLSIMSNCSMEAVSAATQHPFNLQISIFKDRGFLQSLIDRARVLNCPALVLTLDLHQVGKRHRDAKNGLAVPPRLSFRHLIDFATKPNWAWSLLRTRHRSFGNLDGQLSGVQGRGTIAQWAAEQLATQVGWDDVSWVRERWDGKLIIKGVLDADDAALAVQAGADAVLVSNHGGRQLDGADSSIRTLPAIVERIGDQAEVHLDSGVRTGQHVLKALAQGARCVHLGRAHLYGLAAAGQAGVEQAIALLHEELRLTLAFCGCQSVADIHPGILLQPR